MPAAVAQPVAAAVSDGIEAIVVPQERLPVGGVVPAVGASRVAAGGAVGAQGAGVAGMPAGAMGMFPTPGAANKELADTAKKLALMSMGLVEPALQPLISVLLSLQKAFDPAAGGGLILNYFKGLGGGVGTAGVGGGVLEEVSITAQKLPELFPDVGEGALALTTAGTTVATALTTAGTTSATALTTAGTAPTTALTTAGTAIATAITTAGATAASAIAAAATAGGAAKALGGLKSASGGDLGWLFTDIFGMATGGKIKGPGTGTSDSVPLWGSAGEFLVKAKAVAGPASSGSSS